MRHVLSAALLLGLVSPACAEAPEKQVSTDEARLLRFPTIHGDRIVFTYAGNLYAVSSTGGVARRLTHHDGFEMFPRFSPDGKHLAFTGQYDGNTEVFVMSSEGGTPKRLTYTATLGRDEVSDRMGPNNIVLGWSPDGKSVVFRSRMRSFNDFIGQLYLAPMSGGLPEQLPLPRGGFCSYSPDGKQLAYNRVFREFRTWKRYRGGMADDIWIYDFETKKTENLTGNEAQDVFPMWSGSRIYFLSDRDASQRMNLFAYDLKDKTTRQVTRFTDFDVKFPSLGDKVIVFENGGWIYRLDLATEQADKVPIRILEDEAPSRQVLTSVSKNVTNYEIAPDGKRALFGARGEVFTVPAQNGPTRNLTSTSGAHERNSKWSPDGKAIAYVSDVSGEDEIYVLNPNGRDKAVQLTTNADSYKYELSWSPDSKKILWSDRKLRVQYVDVASKKVTVVHRAPVWEVRDVVWSPDSRWVAWSQEEREGLDRLYLHSLEQNRTHAVTDGWHASSTPAFSGDGKYLFFVSNRDFNPIYSSTEWNHAYRDTARIFVIPLAKDTPSPFRPRSDEVGEMTPKPEEPKKDAPIKIDVEGLNERVLGLPIQAASYRNLQSVGSTLYYIRQGSKDAKAALQMYDLTQRKETALGSVGGYEISADGKKMLVSQDGKYGIIDLPKAAVTLSETINLAGLEMLLDRRAEWKQIYHECWRQMRDFFYDEKLHGLDWKGLRDRYEPLFAHVNHRADLTYIIGELIGELNAGHAYVGGGDLPKPSRVSMGLLGAELERDAKSGYYRIKKILKGSSWEEKLRSPLAEIGVDAKEGDYLVAIDGHSTKDMVNPYEALLNTADKQVTLKLNAKPQGEGARDVLVRPISTEADLYYREWVNGNLKKVTAATDGKVGYLHVPDMLASGLNEFVRQFYPQLHKKALIVDMRGNGGGNVSPMLIERLRREIAMITIARNSPPNTNPAEMIWGPMVCLMNEYSASDGDLFPYRFRHYGMGKLIGKRSWGGVVGIRGTLPLLDGGYLNRPEFSRYDVAGKEWIIEGKGVTPDIVIDNDPAREYGGADEQLDKGITVIQEELKTKEKTIPPPPTPKR